MMKNLPKSVIICAVAFLILNMASVSHAQSMAKKLDRGLINIFTGWFEIPKGMSAGTQKRDFASALFTGLPKGFLSAVIRTGSGIYDTLTFPLPLPESYRPILEPEFVFENK